MTITSEAVLDPVRDEVFSFSVTYLLSEVFFPFPITDLSEAFHIIVENIGRDWRRLARRLPGSKITETEIEELTDRHIRDLREQSRGALVLWQHKNPQQANKSVLIDALRQCEMNYIADIVEGLIAR